MKKLTEKDAIWCKTQKQWDSIIEMFDLKVSKKIFKSCCILYPMEKGISDCSSKLFAKDHGYTIHKAKDILKKSKIDKLREYVEDIESSYGKRLNKIEKELSANTTVSKMESVEPLKFDLPTKELEELPKKWCVKADENNINEIGKFFNRGIDEIYNNIRFVNKYFHSHNLFNGIHILDIIGSGWNFANAHITETYTEITFNQFKKWVLKEDDFEKDTDVLLKDEQKPLSIREVQVKVSNQEEANECAEIAKACGEKVLFDSMYKEKLAFFYIESDYFNLYLNKSKTKKLISLQEFRERFGKKQETEIEWSKAGQLLENDSYIVAIEKDLDNNNLFLGIILKFKIPSGYRLFSSVKFSKNNFKLCAEPITLKNE